MTGVSFRGAARRVCRLRSVLFLGTFKNDIDVAVVRVDGDPWIIKIIPSIKRRSGDPRLAAVGRLAHEYALLLKVRNRK